MCEDHFTGKFFQAAEKLFFRPFLILIPYFYFNKYNKN